MKLKGILDFSLGNFLCLRGFAPMGVLQDISKPDENVQRVPRDERLREIREYLRKGEFVFFPEVILCVGLCDSDMPTDAVARLYENVTSGIPSKTLRFAKGLRFSSVVAHSRKSTDIRAIRFFQVGTVQFDAKEGAIFSRIDGNHRLAASTDAQVRDRTTPFCIVFCRDGTEFRRFGRALFHNINYKQVPLPKEHNLRLILEDAELFTDEKLKADPSFGWPYYLARQLNSKLDLDFVPNLKRLIETEPLSFLVDQLSFLTAMEVLGDNEYAVKRFKDALAKVNATFAALPRLSETRNRGLLAAMVYYELTSPAAAAAFIRWVLQNHLHLIADSSTPDLIKIFDKVTETRKRTIFVSMPFGKTKPDDHYATIEAVCEEITRTHNLNPPLKVERVNLKNDGTSDEIVARIIRMISECGLLIANLTHCNPNVYHEVGFIMGKARAEGIKPANLLLFLDESVSEKDRFVGFNLRGMAQIRFTQTMKQFAPELRKNIEKFYGLIV
jgi:hypothetical protein